MTTTIYNYNFEGNNYEIKVTSNKTVTGYRDGNFVFYRECGDYELFLYENSLVSKFIAQNVPYKITTIKE